MFIGRTVAWQRGVELFTIAGWPVTSSFVLDGMAFSLSLLGFLTVHEFGHYFAARHHRVRTSLPYYIPSPLIGIGTLGAVIRIRERIPATRVLFDIGAAGPLAGFVVALGLLLYAMATIPSPEYMFGVGGHEALRSHIEQTGQFPSAMLPSPEGIEGARIIVGNTALYWILSQFFADIPPMYEMYHYPVLFAAWLGLFFTALNLMPVGQLDGGHILYALVGRAWHGRLARVFMLLMLLSMTIGLADDGPQLLAGFFPWLAMRPLLLEVLAWMLLGAFLFLLVRRIVAGWQILPIGAVMLLLAAVSRVAIPGLAQFGYSGWALWCILLIFFVRMDHPPVVNPAPLSRSRRMLGILSLVIFVLCFSIRPLYIV